MSHEIPKENRKKSIDSKAIRERKREGTSGESFDHASPPPFEILENLLYSARAVRNSSFHSLQKQ